MEEGILQESLAERFAAEGGRRALVSGPEALSYEDLRRRAETAAASFRALWDDSRRHIGFCLGNCIPYVTHYCGALFAGHLPLLLDAHFNAGEIEAVRDECGLDALVIDRKKAQKLEVHRDGDPLPLEGEVFLLKLKRTAEPPYKARADTEVCRFTSGTTGSPKCLEFSGTAVLAAARNWVRGTSMGKGDKTLCLAALSNGLAFNTSLLSTFLAGGELHFHQGLPLTRRVARRVAKHGITRLVAFPALYRNFVAPGGATREVMASLKHAISAGAPLWSDVREEFRSLYGIDISDYYGIAETGPCTFETERGYHKGLGEPLPGVEIRIVPSPEDPSTGEVLVRTQSMASGYLNHPELLSGRTDADGFYHSGDRGRIVDGRLHLVGRTQDHINVGGRKIDPTEVLAVVVAVDGVADAVAFPDEDLNRETLVHLVVVASTPELTREKLVAACRARLAGYKVPAQISFVKEIPRSGIGKPRIALLREQLREGAAQNRG